MTEQGVYVNRLPSAVPALGRHVVHDPRSKSFPRRMTVDPKAWHDKIIRIIDPRINPNQSIGNCTGCSKCMQLNAMGNRRLGIVLGMPVADRFYGLATTIDPWPGSYPPDDTGSSGLAAAKAAQQLGYGGEYRWLFGGADEVVQTIMEGQVRSVGTWWYYDMFKPDSKNVVRVNGGKAGGHQWTVRGYDKDKDLLLGRCWWGTFRDFWISRFDLSALLADEGDSHVQRRI